MLCAIYLYIKLLTQPLVVVAVVVHEGTGHRLASSTIYSPVAPNATLISLFFFLSLSRVLMP